MSRKILVAALCIAAATLLLVLTPAGSTLAQNIQQVFVTNFPDLLRVEGEVSVKGPIRQGVMVALRDIVVSPVSPKDTTRLVQAGTVVTDGFANVVLSLTGQIRGEIIKSGTVGAILIPNEELSLRAFEEKGEMQFPLEVIASSVTSASPFFASNQPRYPVAFPSYRVVLYNTSSKTVSVNLYAYLTN